MLIGLGVLSAAAVPYVVADTDVEAARAAVAAELDVAPDAVRVLTPAQVRARQPWAENGAVQVCQGAPSRSEEVADLIETARLQYGRDAELDAASATLTLAVERVVCATEPADEELLFKLFFARGYYEAVRGDEAAATRAFRTARNLRPDSPWDMDYPPEDGEALFDAAQDGESVRVGFAPVPRSLVVDGTRVTVPRTTLDLSSGQHVLQFGAGEPLHSSMLFDPERLPMLVVPGLLPTDGARWIAPDLAPDLATILGRVLPADAELWVVTDEALHRSPLRELAWERIERPPPPPPPPAPEPVVEKRRPSWARWVAVGATGVALGGLGTAGVTKLQADGLQVTDTLDPDAERYERLRGAHLASWVVAGSSSGVALGALYLDLALGGR